MAKFYAEAGAAHIIITGRTSASLETARSELMASYPETAVTPFSADVGSKDSVTALWKYVNEKDIQVDVLVNNAGR
jgi:NADP-dependent 3-hydroxy acid dehydrogenase YdfG